MTLTSKDVLHSGEKPTIHHVLKQYRRHILILSVCNKNCLRFKVTLDETEREEQFKRHSRFRGRESLVKKQWKLLKKENKILLGKEKDKLSWK